MENNLYFGDFENTEALLLAIREALEKGQDSIRIRYPQNNRLAIIALPDHNELLSFQQICTEYQELQSAGLTLKSNDEKESIEKFITGLQRLVESTEITVNTLRYKQPKDVELEIESQLGLAIRDYWETIKRRNADMDSRRFQLVFYKTEDLKRIFNGAVKMEYLDKSTSEKDFLYLFDSNFRGVFNKPLLWTNKQTLLSVFIKGLTCDPYLWSKTAKSFRYFDIKLNKYVVPNPTNLRTDASREINTYSTDPKAFIQELL